MYVLDSNWTSRVTIAASVNLVLNEMNKFSFEYSSGLQQLEYVRFWRKESGRELVLISHEVSAGITFPTYNSAFSITHLSHCIVVLNIYSICLDKYASFTNQTLLI